MKLPSVKDMSNPDRLTDKALRALRMASRLAWECHHRQVAPEHLLAALSRMEPSVARVTLGRLGLDLGQESERVAALVAAIRPEAQGGEPSAGPALDCLLEEAKVAAESLVHDWVGTEHLVLGMLARSGNACCDFLARQGIAAEGFRAAVWELLAGR
jgi:ATP-dependent Clp protease ATP-binding subunit ClpC